MKDGLASNTTRHQNTWIRATKDAKPGTYSRVGRSGSGGEQRVDAGT
jgi:hypothetical protein